MEITAVRHAYPEPSGFCMIRKNGYQGEYTFLHFHNSVEMMVDGKKFMTQPHAVILYEPGVPQYFNSLEPLIHDWMHFRGEPSELMGVANPLLNTVCYPANPAFITEITAEIESEHFQNKPNRERLMRLKAEELFIKASRALNEQDTEPQSVEMIEKLRVLRGKMLLSLEENWTVKRMADSVFLSESRFYTVYKKCFGISPTADLINARMNSAKHMLAFGKKTIGEIADQLGYQNTTHFIRQFRAYIGTTPARYRKEFI